MSCDNTLQHYVCIYTYVPTILVYGNLYNIYICIVKIMLWVCHHRTFEKLKLQNSGPIVLIKVSTIVLKEGRSERGYNPETPILFHINQV